MRFALWTVVLLLLCTSALSAQGKLGKIRNEVKPQPSPSHRDDDDDDDDDHKHRRSGNHHGRHHRRSHCDDDSSTLGLFLGLLFNSDDDEGPTYISGATYQDTGPDGPTYVSGGEPIYSETGQAQSGHMEINPLPPPPRDYFPPYPYHTPFDGYAQERRDIPPEEEEILGTGALRVGLENGNDFDDVNRFNFTALIQTSSGFGLHTRLDFLSEDLDDGSSDDLTLGTTDLIYYFLTAEQFQTFVGVGVRYLHDLNETDFGYNLTWGFDVFPVKPVVISFILDYGSIGEADVFHVRSTVGAVLGLVEIFAGYDYREIGGVDVQGPLAGLRLWF